MCEYRNVIISQFQERKMKVSKRILITTSLLLSFLSTVSTHTFAESDVAEMVGKMDDNADKKIDFKEFFEDTVTDNQDSYDVNHDGYITAGEVALELKEDLVETVAEMNRIGVSEKNADATIVKSLSSIEKRSEAIVKQMDTDGDNLVEADELEAFKHKQFDALDKNKDGVISSADLVKKPQHKGFPIRLQ